MVLKPYLGFSISLPTIKELLKELGKTRVHTTEFDDMICFSDQDLYLRFKQAIKQLKKDNKKLKPYLGFSISLPTETMHK